MGAQNDYHEGGSGDDLIRAGSSARGRYHSDVLAGGAATTRCKAIATR